MRISKKRWEDLQEYLVWLESKAKGNHDSFQVLRRDVNNLLAQRSVDDYENHKDEGEE